MILIPKAADPGEGARSRSESSGRKEQTAIGLRVSCDIHRSSPGRCQSCMEVTHKETQKFLVSNYVKWE